jgi:hypothetical protein
VLIRSTTAGPCVSSCWTIVVTCVSVCEALARFCVVVVCVPLTVPLVPDCVVVAVLELVPGCVVDVP